MALASPTCAQCIFGAISTTHLSYTQHVLKTITVELIPHVTVYADGQRSTSYDRSTITEVIVGPTQSRPTGLIPTGSVAGYTTYTDPSDITWTVEDATLTYPTTYVQYLSFAGGAADTYYQDQTCVEPSNVGPISLGVSTLAASFIFAESNATASGILPTKLLNYLDTVPAITTEFPGLHLTACETLPASDSNGLPLVTLTAAPLVRKRFEGPRTGVIQFGFPVPQQSSEAAPYPFMEHDKRMYDSGNGTGAYGSAISGSAPGATSSFAVSKTSDFTTQTHSTAFIISTITGRAIVTSAAGTTNSPSPPAVIPGPNTALPANEGSGSAPGNGQGSSNGAGGDGSTGGNSGGNQGSPNNGGSSNNGGGSSNDGSSNDGSSNDGSSNDGSSDGGGSSNSGGDNNDNTADGGGSSNNGEDTSTGGSSGQVPGSNGNSASSNQGTSVGSTNGHNGGGSQDQGVQPGEVNHGVSGNSGSASDHTPGTSNPQESTNNAMPDFSNLINEINNVASQESTSQSQGSNNGAAAPAPAYFVGTMTVSRNADGAYVYGSQMLAPGSTLMVGSGAVQTPVVVQTTGGVTQLMIDGQTAQPIPTSANTGAAVAGGLVALLNAANDAVNSPAPLVVTTNSQTFTAVQSGAAVIIAGASSTLTVSRGSVATFQGQTVSAAASGSAMVVNGQTITAARLQATGTTTTTSSSVGLGDYVESGIANDPSSTTPAATSAEALPTSGAARNVPWLFDLVRGFAALTGLFLA